MEMLSKLKFSSWFLFCISYIAIFPDSMTSSSSGQPQVDLFLVCDTTASMGLYISSLASTIRQVFAIIKLLFHGRVKLHVVSYKDYCDGKAVVTHCGQRTHTNKQILQFVADLAPQGGGDIPEAIKTALNHVHAIAQEIKKSTVTSQAIVVIFTDAPPHHMHTSSRHLRQEMDAIATNPKYTAGSNWMSIRQAFSAASIPIYTFHSMLDCEHRTAHSVLFYSALGPVVLIDDVNTTQITKATMGLLLQLMGQRFEHADNFSSVAVWDAEKLLFDCDTKFPPLDSTLVLRKDAFEFQPLACMQEDLRELPHLFKTNEDYQSMVYSVFHAIFTPENVLALTYNPILAKLWRLCSNRRLDPRYSPLSAQLSRCVPALSGLEKAQLQQWIEESHDDSEAIRDAILANTAEVDRPCLILESGFDTISAADLRSLARAPNPGVISALMSVLTHLQYLPSVPTKSMRTDDGVPMYIPLDLTDNKLFSYLSHLVVPGTSFSMRGSAIVAMICCSSNVSLLKDRAHGYLESIRGQWIPLHQAEQYPEILSLEFIKLMHRNATYLTQEEMAVYEQLFVVHRMRLAATKNVTVTLGATPTKTRLHPDIKRRCHKCGYDVSLTLMTTPDTCALCRTYGAQESRSLQRLHTTPADKSFMVECCACHALYAVVRPELLNISPKCYYCRQWVKPSRIPTVECSTCLNRYVDPAGLIKQLKRDNETWTCFPCQTAPNVAVTTRETTFENLLTSNTALCSHFGWKKPKRTDEFVRLVFDRHWNYFKMFTRQHGLLFEMGPKAVANAKLGAPVATLKLQVGGKPLLKVDALVGSLVSDILHGSLQDVCNLCFEDFTLPALESACGRCRTRVCEGCARGWYSEPKRGRLLLATHLACPFCRQPPSLGTWKKYNRSFVDILNKLPVMRANYYYGWCGSCGDVKEWMEKQCSREAPQSKFECVFCSTPQVGNLPHCPGCNAKTEKTEGCDHITCICGQHWCYRCGKGFLASEIYTHLGYCLEGL
ncbi:hypothetical protein AeMF1_003450 [Aphanomyces euteiches]|nr:hypothetical protein AeMF1_003450 [Aphanomyces euteiches]KAH9191533.1 hypothetical protein AeNC1_006493 [Aphanomyces euteiches]